MLTATTTRISFYADLANNGVGPSLVTLRVEEDPYHRGTGRLMQDTQRPDRAVRRRLHASAAPPHPRCVVKKRQLASGFVWPSPGIFAYYDYDGDAPPGTDARQPRTCPGSRASTSSSRSRPTGSAPTTRRAPRSRGCRLPNVEISINTRRSDLMALTGSGGEPRDERRPRRGGRDEGSALMIVLVTMTILSVVATVALTGSDPHPARSADRSEDWQAALAAAEAGVDDYLARLNRDDNYWRADCSNVALTPAPRPARAVRLGLLDQSSGWAARAGPDGVPVPLRRRRHQDASPPGRSSQVDRQGRQHHPHHPGGPAPRRVRRVPLLHRLRDQGPGRTTPADHRAERCAHYYWPSLPKSAARHLLLHRHRLHHRRHDQRPAAHQRRDPDERQAVVPGHRHHLDPQCPATNGPARRHHCYVPIRSPSPVRPRHRLPPEVELPTSIGDLRQYVTRAKTHHAGLPLHRPDPDPVPPHGRRGPAPR